MFFLKSRFLFVPPTLHVYQFCPREKSIFSKQRRALLIFRNNFFEEDTFKLSYKRFQRKGKKEQEMLRNDSDFGIRLFLLVAAIAPWFCLCLLPCGPGFESQAHLLS